MPVFTQVTRAHITAKDLPCIIAYKANLKPNAHAVPLRAIHHDLLLSLDLTQLYIRISKIACGYHGTYVDFVASSR